MLEELMPKSVDKSGASRYSKVIAVVVIVAAWSALAPSKTCVAAQDSIPTDAQMIAHFNQHRSDFDRLVDGYRNFRGSRVFYEQSSAGAKALAKRVGIYHMITGAPGAWYPDPYSERTLKLMRSLYAGPLEKRPTALEIMNTLKKEMPDLFHIVDAPLRGILDVARVTDAIALEPGTEKGLASYYRREYRGSELRKDYVYFPQIPRVEGGRLLSPLGSVVRPTWRVLDSLDEFPPNWERGECVLRRIEPQWFLRFCRLS